MIRFSKYIAILIFSNGSCKPSYLVIKQYIAFHRPNTNMTGYWGVGTLTNLQTAVLERLKIRMHYK